MTYSLQNKRISSVISILPPTVVRYEDELSDYNFPVAQSLRLGKMMDYGTRRQCGATDGLSDYALFGINRLLAKGVISKDEIDGLVVVSSSQDYIMPAVSYIIQGKLGLPSSTYCCDILQVCGGYVFGLMHTFMVMDTLGLKKVLLVTGDLLTKKVGMHDRNSRPIIGDAVNVTVVENVLTDEPLFCTFENYGEQADAIKIPAGGLKMPSSPQTALETKDETGNYRALDHFYMDGEGVFNFVMTRVPPMIEQLIADSQWDKNDIDYYLFHQPNKYMIERLKNEMDLPADRCFSNIVGIYGNASTATIPLNMCHNLTDIAVQTDLNLCLSGFGCGLTCNAMLIHNPKMVLSVQIV